MAKSIKKNKSFKFSIIIISKDEDISGLLKDVILQKYKKWEVFICIKDSVIHENTKLIAKSYSNIQLYDHELNNMIKSEILNFFIDKCNGEIILRLYPNERIEANFLRKINKEFCQKKLKALRSIKGFAVKKNIVQSLNGWENTVLEDYELLKKIEDKKVKILKNEKSSKIFSNENEKKTFCIQYSIGNNHYSFIFNE